MLTTVLTGTQFFLFILGTFTVLYWIIPYRRRWIVFFITVLLFAYFAHMLVPDRSDDLQLYFWFIDRIREGGQSTFNYLVANDNFGWETYFVCKYYYRFFTLLPDSRYDHFLSSVTIFITYGLSLLTIYRASKRFDISRQYTYLGTLFFLATYWFYDSASGIRSSIAIGIVFACAYQQFVEKKHIVLCFIGYFLAAFFHPGGVIALVIVIITFITFNTDGKFFYFLLLFSVALGTRLVNYLGSVTDIGFIQAITERSEKYSQRAGDDSSTAFYVMVVTLILVSSLILYFSRYIRNSDKFSEFSKFYKYSLNTVFFLIGIMMISVVFSRFVRWVLPQIGSIFFMLGMQFQENEIQSKGVSEAMYFSTPVDRFMYRLRPFVIILFVVFIIVYIWYDCNGSSLIWAHFEWEWQEAGYPYIWEAWYGDL